MLKRLKRRVHRGRLETTTTTRQPIPPSRLEGANHSPATLQSWRGSPRLLFVSAPENFHGRTSFRDSWQSLRGLHQGSKGHSGQGLPWRLSCLEISLEAMYRRRRSLFSNLIMCCTDLFNKFFLIDSLIFLFGQTMYVQPSGYFLHYLLLSLILKFLLIPQFFCPQTSLIMYSFLPLHPYLRIYSINIQLVKFVIKKSPWWKYILQYILNHYSLLYQVLYCSLL